MIIPGSLKEFLRFGARQSALSTRCGLSSTFLIFICCLTLCAIPGGRSQNLPLSPGERSLSQTIEASAFISSLGVNTHLNYNTSAYQNVAAVENAMRYLGLNTLRDLGGQSWTSVYDKVASDGFRFDFIAPGQGATLLSPTALTSWLSTFQANHPGSIASIEGLNEINFWTVSYNGQSGIPAGIRYQTDLYHALKATPSLAGIPDINFSLGYDNQAAFTAIGQLPGISDRGVAHIYIPWGAQPSVSFFNQLSWAQSVTPGEPMSVTETGYNTLVGTALGVDEPTQAKMILNLVFDAAKAGVASTFLYELVDDTAFSGNEAHWGLYHSDWTPKPAATALHNLTTILTTNDGAAPLSAAPSYTVSGLDGYNASTAIHEANGTYDIVVWREPQIWNSSTNTAIGANTETATIQLSQAVAGYEVYDPITGATPISSGGAGSTIQVQLTDHPLIIELRGDSTSTTTGTTTGTTTTGTTTPSAQSSGVTISGGDPTVYTGTANADTITGGSGWDRVNGKQGDDVILGRSTVGDWLSGGQGNDLIDVSASNGNNIGNGNLGADTLVGGSGADTLRGGQGDDVIHAGSGTDWISGDLGNNTIYGGQGMDTFHATPGHDSITGWHAGDHVQVDNGVTFATAQVGSDVHVSFSNGGEIDLLNTQVSSLQLNWILTA